MGKPIWEGDGVFGRCEIITSRPCVCALSFCVSLGCFLWLVFLALTTINTCYSRGLDHTAQKILIHRRVGGCGPPPTEQEVFYEAGVEWRHWGSATKMKVDQLDRSVTLPVDRILNFLTLKMAFLLKMNSQCPPRGSVSPL